MESNRCTLYGTVSPEVTEAPLPSHLVPLTCDLHVMQACLQIRLILTHLTVHVNQMLPRSHGSFLNYPIFCWVKSVNRLSKVSTYTKTTSAAHRSVVERSNQISMVHLIKTYKSLAHLTSKSSKRFVVCISK